MLDFICGEVIEIGENSAVIKNGGFGYSLFISAYTKSRLSIGDSVQLYCHLQVREDALVLFGFWGIEEKTLFKNLVTVSGVGPKMAISLLSGMRAGKLALCIVSGDYASLCTIKGLGKKTAEKIVLELREKLNISKEALPQEEIADVNAEAVEVLRSLGIGRKEAVERVKRAIDSGMTTTEQILNFALRNA